MVDQNETWDIQPIKLMLTMAVMQGNPLFQHIPTVINGAKAEYKEELKRFMMEKASIAYGEEVSKWLYKYYEYIDDQVPEFCYWFWHCDIRQELHQAVLFASLLVRGDLTKIYHITAMVTRYPNIWKTIKMKALLTKTGLSGQFKIQTKISEQ